MPTETSLAERIAALEAHIQNLRDRIVGIEAAQQQTVREFREALEKHNDDHTTKAKEAGESKWKWVSAVLGLFAVAGPIATLVATQLLD